MSAERARIAAAWLPALLYMGVIWILSSFAVIETPFELDQFPHHDKVIHFFEYAGLAFFIAHAVMRTWSEHSRIRVAALAVLLTSMFGLSDEIHQSFVPGRHADVFDLVADIAGSLAGTTLRHALSWIRVSLGGTPYRERTFLDSSSTVSGEFDRSTESAERSSDGWTRHEGTRGQGT